jgi:DNA-binding XRE family transcriptional regulator
VLKLILIFCRRVAILTINLLYVVEKSELQQFGDRVRTLRKERGLSQEQLAERTGLHRTYIGGIERGERNVSLINIVRLAKALEVSPSDLLQGI